MTRGCRHRLAYRRRLPAPLHAAAAVLVACMWLWLGALVDASPALALKAIDVADQDRIEISNSAEFVDQRGDNLQVETAPGADGVAGRMAVKASSPGLNPNWVVFALRNTSDKPIERWVTAERYTVIGSGIVWPDLDTRRIEAVTPSVGFLPERVKSDRADLFRVTLDPGQTVTYAVELASDRFARIYLWKPVEYELKARDRQLFNGILLGITGVLGIFLTAVFAANHKPIFPSAALLTWCVLAYLCVDFGFWHKLFQLRPEDNAVYRAATEAAMAASLLVFIYIFLRLTASHGFARMLLGVWIIAQIGLIAVAVIDARLAATFARASFAGIAAFGILTTAYLAMRGQDRALSLLPTWILFLVWVFAAAMTLTGRLNGDIVVSSLVAGLVLITVLVGFTVTQFAFRSLEPVYGAAPNEQQVRSLAIEGSGAAVWEWNARREEIKTGPTVEAALGLAPGELSCKVDDFCAHLHPSDRERFRLLLWSVQERGGGEIRIDLRMRHSDNSYRWFDIEAAAVPSPDRRVLRCVGLVREITDMKRAQERLLHDAVHDSLTGLPNRELFIDRLAMSVARAKDEPNVSPTVLVIDMDKFKSVNASFGLIVGDSLLLTLARRLQRHLEPQDTLSRIGGNQFAILLMRSRDASDLAQFAERLRRSLRSPIKLSGQDIVLTGSIGIAICDAGVATAEELLKEAEIAMYRAKRGGADRIEIFRDEFRHEVDDRVAIESDLRAALEKKQIMVLYQPIIALGTEELAGYEALVRWQHPKLGLLNPSDFVPVAEESDLIVKLGSYVLSQAVEDAAGWQKLLPRVERAVFVSVNVSSRQLFRQDLIQEIRHIAGRAKVPPGCLRLEITESLVMENPERAVEVLEWLRSAGAGLSIDDFGTGYSSLAYLHRFPFDTIKIDRDLVQSSSSEGTGSVIVRSIVALAHELGKKVVAEGVEAESDVAFLRSIGCEFAQGYYYGEPMTDREVEKMLKVIRKTEHRMERSSFLGKSVKRRRRGDRKVRQSPGAEAPAAANGASPAAAAPGQRPAKGLRTRPRNAGQAPRSRPAAAPSVPTGFPEAAPAAAGFEAAEAAPAANGYGYHQPVHEQPHMPPQDAYPQNLDGHLPPHGQPQTHPPAYDAPEMPLAAADPTYSHPAFGGSQHSAYDSPDFGLPPAVDHAPGAPPVPQQPMPMMPPSDPASAPPTYDTDWPQTAQPMSHTAQPAPAYLNGASAMNGAADHSVPPLQEPSVQSAPQPEPPRNTAPPARFVPRPHRQSAPPPDLSTLPPAIAASLAKLARPAPQAAPAAPAEAGAGDDK